MRTTTLLMAVLVAAAAGACATTQEGPLTPLVLGWENYFTLEWAPAEHNGHPVLEGYVKNEWGLPAIGIRLLADTLDADGRILAQQIEWVGPRVLTPGTRSYFEIPVATPGAAYRVSVFSYDWLLEDHHHRRRLF